MVIRTNQQRGGWFGMDIAVAIGLLIVALLPLAYSFAHERQLARIYYWRAVAMEIVDGEFETLVAGEWRGFPAGTQDYSVRAQAATNLPPGKFSLTCSSNYVRLEWVPARKHSGSKVAREAHL